MSEVCFQQLNEEDHDEKTYGSINEIFKLDAIDNLSRDELYERLIQSHKYCTELEDSKQTSKKLNEQLQTDIYDQQRKFTILEEDRRALRNTIKKASANWFQRRARFSESELSSDGDSSPKPDTNLDGAKELNEKVLSKSDDAFRLSFDLKFKIEQLELSERRCEELNKRLRDYETVIDDQEIIIHGLKEQLDTYFNDNTKMSKQLAELIKLFQELEAANNHEVNDPSQLEDSLDSDENLPSQEEFGIMSTSVSKTYIKLKELIYEKKSLVTEIERLKTLNVELQLRVSQQENRLVSVSDALQTTWLIVSNLKDDHAKIHTSESILRYELKEKREILTDLRTELEWAREQWRIIRNINTQTEEQWQTLRNEIDERKIQAEKSKSDSTDVVDAQETGACAPICREVSFEPPIDLLLDMGIEYGVVDADDEEPATGVALMEGQDVNADRLQDLEDQCCHLYQKLMTSTSRALALASRLTSLHEHYAGSNDEGDEDDDEDDEDYMYEELEENIFESEIVSPDSGGYDTAYVSEADGADSLSTNGAPTGASSENLQQIEHGATGVQDDDTSPEYVEEGCDILSRRLINILPKKIEILRSENKKLEDKLQTIQDEQAKSEAALKSSVEFEIRHRKQLETQLSHLGKCVDELKLERNGKIAKVEEELQKKMLDVQKEHEEHENVLEELESIKEKFEERGELLQLTAMQLEQSEKRADTAEESLRKLKIEINTLEKEIEHLKEASSCQKSRLCVDTQNQGVQTISGVLEEHWSSCSGESSCIQQDNTVGSVSSWDGNVNQNRIELPILPEPLMQREMSLPQDSTLYLPCYLDSSSILRWIFKISTEEIRFGITFNNIYPQNIEEGKGDDNLLVIPSQLDLNTHLLPIGPPVDLICPILIRSSDSPTKGKLTPRIPGKFCLIFRNHTARPQEITFKIWMESNQKVGETKDP